MNVPLQIKLRAEKLKQGRKVYKMTVRNFLGYFGAERRGAVRVEAIQEILNSLGLDTEPNFQSAWIDGYISLRLKDGASPDVPSSTDTSNDDFEDDEEDDEYDETVPEDAFQQTKGVRPPKNRAHGIDLAGREPRPRVPNRHPTRSKQESDGGRSRRCSQKSNHDYG